MRIYLRYQDDGAQGLCGQAYSITESWDILHIFEDEDDAHLFKRAVEMVKSRKNPRITNRWDDRTYGMVPEVKSHIKGDSL